MNLLIIHLHVRNRDTMAVISYGGLFGSRTPPQKQLPQARPEPLDVLELTSPVIPSTGCVKNASYKASHPIRRQAVTSPRDVQSSWTDRNKALLVGRVITSTVRHLQGQCALVLYLESEIEVLKWEVRHLPGTYSSPRTPLRLCSSCSLPMVTQVALSPWLPVFTLSY